MPDSCWEPVPPPWQTAEDESQGKAPPSTSHLLAEQFQAALRGDSEPASGTPSVKPRIVRPSNALPNYVVKVRPYSKESPPETLALAKAPDSQNIDHNVRLEAPPKANEKASMPSTIQAMTVPSKAPPFDYRQSMMPAHAYIQPKEPPPAKPLPAVPAKKPPPSYRPLPKTQPPVAK